MHADRPGDRPRLLYWYRTAPGIALGRLPLDEDAIRTIEEQHPDIDFDWPALIALAAAMTPEDEAPPVRPPQQQRQQQGKRQRGREPRPQAPPRAAEQESREPGAAIETAAAESIEADPIAEADTPVDVAPQIELPPPSNRLVEELAGREIGSRLRARYAEIMARIQDLDVDGDVKDTWFKRAEAIDPELWMTPEQVLDGVRNADAQYEKLRAALAAP